MVSSIFKAYATLRLGTGEPIDYLFIRRLEWRAVRRYLNLTGQESVCDVAGGAGNWARRLTAQSQFVASLDLDPSALNWAVQKTAGTNPVFVCSDAQRLPFPSASFDRVVSICALEHFQEDARALHEMARILKPEGILVLTVDSLSHPSGFSGKGLDQYRRRHAIRRCYQLQDVEGMAADSGLAVIKHKYLVNSWLSNYFYRLWGSWSVQGKHPNRVEVLFPLIYPIAVLSDCLFGTLDSGAVLAVVLGRTDLSSIGSGSV